jgi:hypothetical protein
VLLVVVGFVLGQFNNYFTTRKERKKAISAALADLLEVRHQYLGIDVTMDELAKLTALQNITPTALISEGRVYGGGLHKVEPKELAQIPATAMLPSLDSHFRVEQQERLFV